MEGERGREKVCVRGKPVNKQTRWMSLLKQRLIQAIRKQSEGVLEKEDTYVWVNGSKYRPRRRRGLLEIIINVPRGVAMELWALCTRDESEPSNMFLSVAT